MEDHQIVALYWQRSESAVAETAKKYGSYCHTLAYGILHSREDAEECVNDTWMKAWNAIPPDRPVRLGMFLAKIVRNLAFNRYQEKNAQKRGGGEIPLVLEELGECLAGEDSAENAYFEEELSRRIGVFVRSLPEREGNVFIRRYFFCESVTGIGKKYRLTENHVSVILSRTRSKLKKFLMEEGYIHET